MIKFSCNRNIIWDTDMVGRNRHNVELLHVADFLLRGAKLTNHDHVRVFHYSEVKLTNQVRLTHYVKRIYSLRICQTSVT